MSDKKKSAKVQEDEFTPKIPNLYKKKCQANGISFSKIIKERLDLAIESGKLQTLQLWEELGPIQIRSLMQALTDLQYPYLKKIRLWKINLEDEGLRTICNYIEKYNTVEYLDLMDNHITQLGCKFLGKVFTKPNCQIKKFRIDNNPIGDGGLRQLTNGLRLHSSIEKLSFNYCNITENGVKYIQEIMANIDCRLRTLKLQGNPLNNQGAYQVLRAVKNCGQFLEKLNLCDVNINILSIQQLNNLKKASQFELQQSYANSEHSSADSASSSHLQIEQKIAHEILSILEQNTSIAKYNYRNNWIPDVVAKYMLDTVKENKTVFLLEMPDCINHVLKEIHNEIFKKRKPKKNKKKKGANGAKKATKGKK